MMKFLRTLYYVLRQGLRSIVKNMFMVFASVCVVFAVLLILGGLWSVSENIQHIIEQYSSRAEVQINLQSYVTEDEAAEMKAAIEKDERVESVKVIGAEENFQKLMDYFKDDADLFEQYKESERLHYISLEIDLKEYADGDAFKAEVRQLSGVDNVKDIVSVISKMEIIRFWIRIGTIFAMIGMAILSVLLIFNTVKLTVFARKREIEIMKYIGAADWYICGPFVIEGVFTGILGALAAYFSLRGIYSLVYNAVTDNLYLGSSVTVLKLNEVNPHFLLLFLAAGIAAGAVASIWAIRKHVNV